jgi:hypothetical protein
MTRNIEDILGVPVERAPQPIATLADLIDYVGLQK